MTKITIGKNKIIIDGHAGYGPSGQDIVCASISILTYTLAEALQGIHRCEEIRPGYVCIEAFPTKEEEQKVEIIFETIIKGLQLLHNEFADFVQM